MSFSSVLPLPLVFWGLDAQFTARPLAPQWELGSLLSQASCLRVVGTCMHTQPFMCVWRIWTQVTLTLQSPAQSLPVYYLSDFKDSCEAETVVSPSVQHSSSLALRGKRPGCSAVQRICFSFSTPWTRLFSVRRWLCTGNRLGMTVPCPMRNFRLYMHEYFACRCVCIYHGCEASCGCWK